MNAEATISAITFAKVNQHHKKRSGRGEMFIAIIQMALASAIVNTGLFMSYAFMRTIQEWNEQYAQSEMLLLRVTMWKARTTYCFVSLSLGGCIFLTKLIVLIRIFFANVSRWRTLTTDIAISILTTSFAILCGVHAFDVFDYPNDKYASVKSFVDAIELTTFEMREETSSALAILHQKLLCCGVHGPYEMAQMSEEKRDDKGILDVMQSEYVNVSHKCILPESCCIHLRPGCNIRKDETSVPMFFKDGCTQRLAQILGEHLLLLSLHSATITVLSLFNILYVETHRKEPDIKPEEGAPTLQIPAAITLEQFPPAIKQTSNH